MMTIRPRTKSFRQTWARAIGLSVLLTLGACTAATRSGATSEPSAQLLQRDLDQNIRERARNAPAFDSSGRRMSWSDIVSAASAADVVLIGENHGHPLGLAAAAALWQDVLSGRPTATLALEFFERDEQLALDDFLSGVTSEADFIKAARRSAGSYPPGHRDMILRAKAAGRPVIAANAPRRYVRLARTDGFDRLAALSDSQRRLFRVPDGAFDPPYRDNFAKIMNLNAGVGTAQPADPGAAAERERQLDASFRSQSTWDWTMGDSIAHATGSPVVLVVGRFHVDSNGGTQQVVRRLKPGARVVTVSFIDADAEPGPELRAEDQGRADVIFYVGGSPESPS